MAPIWRVAAQSAVLAVVLSTLLALLSQGASAHELNPAVADLRLSEPAVLEIELNLEALVSGIDVAAHDDTTAAAEQGDYTRLRALLPEALEREFRAIWPDVAANISILADTARLVPGLDAVEIPAVGDTDLPRLSRIVMSADLPEGTATLAVGWAERYGDLIVRVFGPDADGDILASTYLVAGALSDPLMLAEIAPAGGLERLAGAVPAGFAAVLPGGPQHALFALALFFLALSRGVLARQGATLAIAQAAGLGLAGFVGLTMPATIAVPVLAVSIIVLAIDNIASARLSLPRLAAIAVFGLIHGAALGAVLSSAPGLQAGDPATAAGFLGGALIAQAATVAAAYLVFGFGFGTRDWYRKLVAVPASAVIALAGALWGFAAIAG